MMKAIKFWVALAGAVAGSLSTLYGPDTTVGHVITIVILVAGAVAVYLSPKNAPADPPSQP